MATDNNSRRKKISGGVGAKAKTRRKRKGFDVFDVAGLGVDRHLR